MKKQPHKHAEVIKSWADGAEIECRSDIHSNWIPVKDPSWYNNYEYRIKLEPKLIPFTFEDRELLRGKWVTKKSVNTEWLIVTISEHGVLIHHTYTVNYRELLSDYIFTDGSPCGKYE